MTMEAVLAFVSFFASVSSIVFAYLAFKRSKEQDNKMTGKNEGVMFSDIGYIKACVVSKPNARKSARVSLDISSSFGEMILIYSLPLPVNVTRLGITKSGFCFLRTDLIISERYHIIEA